MAGESAGPKTTTTAIASPAVPSKPRRSGRGWPWLVFLVLAMGVGAYFAYPRVERALSTVSTDDAYVNAHVTFLAPRISESVVEVRFDNNDFVKKGDLVVVLDDAMETIRVAIAGLRQREAAEAPAKLEADRYATLAKNKWITQEQADVRQTDSTRG